MNVNNLQRIAAENGSIVNAVDGYKRSENLWFFYDTLPLSTLMLDSGFGDYVVRDHDFVEVANTNEVFAMRRDGGEGVRSIVGISPDIISFGRKTLTSEFTSAITARDKGLISLIGKWNSGAGDESSEYRYEGLKVLTKAGWSSNSGAVSNWSFYGVGGVGSKRVSSLLSERGFLIIDGSKNVIGDNPSMSSLSSGLSYITNGFRGFGFESKNQTDEVFSYIGVNLDTNELVLKTSCTKAVISPVSVKVGSADYDIFAGKSSKYVGLNNAVFSEYGGSVFLTNMALISDGIATTNKDYVTGIEFGSSSFSVIGTKTKTTNESHVMEKLLTVSSTGISVGTVLVADTDKLDYNSGIFIVTSQKLSYRNVLEVSDNSLLYKTSVLAVTPNSFSWDSNRFQLSKTDMKWLTDVLVVNASNLNYKGVFNVSSSAIVTVGSYFSLSSTAMTMTGTGISLSVNKDFLVYNRLSVSDTSVKFTGNHLKIGQGADIPWLNAVGYAQFGENTIGTDASGSFLIEKNSYGNGATIVNGMYNALIIEMTYNDFIVWNKSGSSAKTKSFHANKDSVIFTSQARTETHKDFGLYTDLDFVNKKSISAQIDLRVADEHWKKGGILNANARFTYHSTASAYTFADMDIITKKFAVDTIASSINAARPSLGFELEQNKFITMSTSTAGYGTWATYTGNALPSKLAISEYVAKSVSDLSAVIDPRLGFVLQDSSRNIEYKPGDYESRPNVLVSFPEYRFTHVACVKAIIADKLTPYKTSVLTTAEIAAAVSNRVISNTPISMGSTDGHTKIKFDSKGLVIGYGNLVASDIPAIDASKITSGMIPVERGGLGLPSTVNGWVPCGNAQGGYTLQQRNGIDTRQWFPVKNITSEQTPFEKYGTSTTTVPGAHIRDIPAGSLFAGEVVGVNRSGSPVDKGEMLCMATLSDNSSTQILVGSSGTGRSTISVRSKGVGAEGTWGLWCTAWTNADFAKEDFAIASHNHDSRYYLKSEVDDKIRVVADSRVVSNAAIVGKSNATKVSYDSKGLITSSGALVSGDIPAITAGHIASGTLPVSRGGTGWGITAPGEILVGAASDRYVPIHRTGIDNRTVFPAMDLTPRPLAIEDCGSTSSPSFSTHVRIVEGVWGAGANSQGVGGCPIHSGAILSLNGDLASVPGSFQLAMGYYKNGKNEVYLRSFNSGSSWTPWYKLWSSRDFSPTSFSNINHEHDSKYANLYHNHTGVYAPYVSVGYSLSNHTHDYSNVYAAISHGHSNYSVNGHGHTSISDWSYITLINDQSFYGGGVLELGTASCSGLISVSASSSGSGDRGVVAVKRYVNGSAQGMAYMDSNSNGGRFKIHSIDYNDIATIEAAYGGQGSFNIFGTGELAGTLVASMRRSVIGGGIATVVETNYTTGADKGVPGTRMSMKTDDTPVIQVINRGATGYATLDTDSNNLPRMVVRNENSDRVSAYIHPITKLGIIKSDHIIGTHQYSPAFGTGNINGRAVVTYNTKAAPTVWNSFDYDQFYELSSLGFIAIGSISISLYKQAFTKIPYEIKIRLVGALSGFPNYNRDGLSFTRFMLTVAIDKSSTSTNNASVAVCLPVYNHSVEGDDIVFTKGLSFTDPASTSIYGISVASGIGVDRIKTAGSTYYSDNYVGMSMSMIANLGGQTSLFARQTY